MDISKIFNCFQNTKEINKLRQEIDQLKQNNTPHQHNPIHMSASNIDDLHKMRTDINKRLEDQNTDVLTKIVFLKEEIQRLDKKVKDLEVNLTSGDNYCIIENRLGGDTSSSGDDSNDDEVDKNNKKETSIPI